MVWQMSYTALYRKFRPKSFDDVKGQDAIVTTLKNQMKAGRIGHAYLFCGTRGTGKTSVAKILARAVNCENPVDGSPCGECAMCNAISSGSSMNVIEIDAASNNGVDNIREIVDEVSYSPAEGKFKVYIIDEVHMLSIGAFNALLKTLEEPPAYVIFILATTEIHKIPITILSRCQRYDFKRIPVEAISDRLESLIRAEGIEVEEKALKYISKLADGALRDAISLLDQCIAFHLGEVLTYDKALNVLGAVDVSVYGRLFELVTDQNVRGCIDLLEEIVTQGRDLTQFVTDFTWYLRNLMLIIGSGTGEGDVEEVIDVSSENLAMMKAEAEMTDLDTVMRYIRIFSELSGRLRYAAQKRILIETALIKLCRPSMETDQESLLARIRQLEEKLEKGLVVTQQPGQPSEQHSAFDQKAAAPKLSYPKAVPEDIKMTVERWPSILVNLDQPMKSYLRSAKLSLGSENQLLIVVEDGLPYDYFTKKEENRELLSRAISQAVQKDIPITIQGIAADRDFDDSYVDLSKLIQMPIEMEEE